MMSRRLSQFSAAVICAVCDPPVALSILFVCSQSLLAFDNQYTDGQEINGCLMCLCFVAGRAVDDNFEGCGYKFPDGADCPTCLLLRRFGAV